jgi:PmbA protein
MNYKKDQQQEFRELAAWVIDQTKKAGAGECKVSLHKSRFVEINYRDHKADVIKEATTQGLSLSVYINNRFAAQSTPDFRKTTLTSFIQDIIDNAKIVEEDPFRTLPDAKYYSGRGTNDLELCDPQFRELTPEQRHTMAKTVEDACLSAGGDKVISVEAGEYDETYEEYIITSNGFEGSVKNTEFWTGAEMTIQDEGDRRPNGYYWVGCRYKNDLPDLQEVGKQAAQRTLGLMGGKKIATETIPIIIENRGAGNVLGGLFSPLSGGSIQQKRSFLADKKEQAIASKLLTIQDDPFILRGMGSRLYDSDGFPARKRDIIKEGVVNEFLIDWYYSRKLGWEPTSGSFSNIIIPPGTRSVDEIIHDLGRCILVTGFIGGNSNSTTGDFSMGIIGKLYDKGEFVQNVSEMNMADNHLKFWNKLVEVANDPWIYGQARFPSLVIDDVVISGI